MNSEYSLEAVTACFESQAKQYVLLTIQDKCEQNPGWKVQHTTSNVYFYNVFW